MMNHALSTLFGLLGGSIPGGLRLAWKVSRNNRTSSGNIDLTVTKKFK